ncbi:MAG: hypothetical protein WKH64_19515 [Chloroflexia bacterium]
MPVFLRVVFLAFFFFVGGGSVVGCSLLGDGLVPGRLTYRCSSCLLSTRCRNILYYHVQPVVFTSRAANAAWVRRLSDSAALEDERG